MKKVLNEQQLYNTVMRAVKYALNEWNYGDPNWDAGDEATAHERGWRNTSSSEWGPSGDFDEPKETLYFKATVNDQQDASWLGRMLRDYGGKGKWDPYDNTCVFKVQLAGEDQDEILSQFDSYEPEQIPEDEYNEWLEEHYDSSEGL